MGYTIFRQTHIVETLMFVAFVVRASICSSARCYCQPKMHKTYETNNNQISPHVPCSFSSDPLHGSRLFCGVLESFATLAQECPKPTERRQMGLSENSVPLHPMVLLIIIPTKWLFHWEYTPFSDIPKETETVSPIPALLPRGLESFGVCCLWNVSGLGM